MSVKRIHLTDFIWVIVPITLFIGYQLYGLPHLRFSYRWIDEGQGYDPQAKRYYTKCTWLGPYGEITEHFPANGKCSVIRFFKSDDSADQD